MLMLVLGGLMLQKTLRPLHSLVLAAFFMVLLNPLTVLSHGFWLSFSAVLLILLFLSGRQGMPKYWSASWSIGWRTGLGLSPLLLLFFGQTSLIAPLANLFAIPIVSFLIIPAALLALCVSPLSEPLAHLLMQAAAWLLEILLDCLQILADIPYAAISLSPPAWFAVLLALVGILLLCLPKGLPGRYLGIVLLLPALAPWQERIEYGQARFTLLDVGQGLAAVVQTAEHVLVFDTGVRLSAGFDMGASVVVPYLRQRGIDGIDQLVLSHADRDHIGGARSVLQAFPVEQIISSDPAHLNGMEAELCKAGKQWNWDGVEFHLLAPLQPFFADDNNNSCVLKVTAGTHSVLLTGDIEREAEEGLLAAYGEQLHSSVLVVPHHGSNTSSSAEFIAQVNAEYALLPAGFQNQYGFPHRKLVERYQQQQTQLFNVAYSGAISIMLGGNEALRLEEYRYNAAHYWNTQ
jgi:competence protein ComEC